MQVFQKKDSLLGGIDEAIAVLKLCSGRRARRDGRTAGRADGPRAARGRRDRAGEPADDRGRLPLFAHLETVYLGSLARRTLVMRNVREVVDAAAASSLRRPRREGAGRGGGRQADPLTRPATTTGSCRPATAGPRTSPARSASRPTRRPRGGAAAASTVPHGRSPRTTATRSPPRRRSPTRRRGRRSPCSSTSTTTDRDVARRRRRARRPAWGVRLDTSDARRPRPVGGDGRRAAHRASTSASCRGQAALDARIQTSTSSCRAASTPSGPRAFEAAAVRSTLMEWVRR